MTQRTSIHFHRCHHAFFLPTPHSKPDPSLFFSLFSSTRPPQYYKFFAHHTVVVQIKLGPKFDSIFSWFLTFRRMAILIFLYLCQHCGIVRAWCGLRRSHIFGYFTTSPLHTPCVHPGTSHLLLHTPFYACIIGPIT